MALETGTFVDDLVATNPPGSDNKAQSDDHHRLIKSVLKATFLNASRAFHFESLEAKDAAYPIVLLDDRKVFTGDATGGAFAFTLPAISVVHIGYRAAVIKLDATANAVTLQRAGADLINGATSVVLLEQNDSIEVMSDGSAWQIVSLSKAIRQLQAIDTTGSSNAYVLATGFDLTPSNGDGVIIVANHSNDGAATLNVDGGGAIDIKRVVDGTPTALITGDIFGNAHYLLTYDSSASAWILLNKEPDLVLYALLASPAFTGSASFAGESQFDGVVQTPAEVLTSSTSIALSMTGKSKKTVELDHNTTITVSGEVADQVVELWIKQGSTGGTAAWAGVDQWVGGSAPTLSTTTGERDLIVLASESDGTTIIAQHLGVAS